MFDVRSITEPCCKRVPLKGIGFVALAENRLEDLIDRDGRANKICCFLKRAGKKGGVGTIRKVFKSAGRIYYVHNLSGSLSTVVSIPFRKPLISESFLREIISILLP